MVASQSPHLSSYGPPQGFSQASDDTYSEVKPTFGGWIAFVIGVSFFGSAIPSWRPEFYGMSIHPCILPMLVGLGWAATQSNSASRRNLGGSGFVMLAAISLAFMMNGVLTEALGSLAKWTTIGLMLLAAARICQNEKDIQLGIIGAVIAVSAMGIRAVIAHDADPHYFINVTPGISSRNGYSQWTLAPFAFVMWAVAERKLSRVGLLLGLFALASMAVPIFLSLSRSGWMVTVATAVLVFAVNRSIRTVVATGIVASAIQVAVSYFSFAEKMGLRYNELLQARVAESGRREFIEAGLEVFSNNPLVGVGLTKVPWAIGAVRGDRAYESHNLMIDILAGTGIIGTLSLLLVGFVILRAWLLSRTENDGSFEYRFARLIPILLVLFVIRGITTNEVIYNPAFMFGLGLAFGAANMVVERRRQGVVVRQENAPVLLPPHLRRNQGVVLESPLLQRRQR